MEWNLDSVCDGGAENLLTTDANLVDQIRETTAQEAASMPIGSMDSIAASSCAPHNTGTTGRVGVGTTNPSVSLHVTGDGQQIWKTMRPAGQSAG